jgi:hypothetical protein
MSKILPFVPRFVFDAFDLLFGAPKISGIHV